MSADGHPPASGSMPHLEPPSLVGTILADRYKLIRKLGEGGMGEVFAAEHLHIEKRFAIKLLRPEIVSNPEAVARFRQEARSSSSIGHRNIIAIEDFGTLPDGRVYMCMELLNGAALNDLITTPQPVERLLNILIQTGHGLAAAHAKNIVHRDMKPENIFVTVGPNNEDIPKLLDFGIAKVAGNDGQNNLTRTGTIFGTPFYMAPEQALGNPVDARTDIYAVGVIMYEVFAGSLPFQGESFMGILTQHITTEPEPISQRAAKAGRPLPPGLADIITRCMHKNPAQRFGTMDELVAALVEIYRQVGGAGMSTYMEAFKVNPTSARMAVPTPGPMGAMPPGGVAPTVGVGAPIGQPNFTPTGMPQMHPPPSGQRIPVPPSGQHGMQHQSGPYDSNAIPVPKKSKTGLIIAIVVILLAIGGGVGAFVIFNQDDTKDGPIAKTDVDAAAGDPVSTKDAAGNAPDIDASGAAGGTVDAAEDIGSNTVLIDAGQAIDPPAIDAGDVVIPTKPDIQVMVKVKGLGNSFEVFGEDGKRLTKGVDQIAVNPAKPITVTIKAFGYKDKTVTLDGTKTKEEFTLEKAPVQKCTAASCPTGQFCAGDGKCKAGCNAASCPSGQICEGGKCKFGPPPGCTATSCPAGQSCGGDGKCKITPPTGCTATSCPAGQTCSDNGRCRPERVDCSASIVNPRDKRCVKQFCRSHPDDVKCNLED